MQIITRDPRLNAPPRVSDLQGVDRDVVLYARAEAQRRAHMAAYAEEVAHAARPPVVEPWWISLTLWIMIFGMAALGWVLLP